MLYFTVTFVSAGWLGAVTVESWTLDQMVVGSIPGRVTPGNNPGQVVQCHTHVSVTKQYKLVLAKVGK